MLSLLKGDSGGPLMSNDSEFTKKNKDDTKPWVLYGITSWGAECATVETPGVFTKVSHYVNWVHAIIRSKSRFMYNTLYRRKLNDRDCLHVRHYVLTPASLLSSSSLL